MGNNAVTNDNRSLYQGNRRIFRRSGKKCGCKCVSQCTCSDCEQCFTASFTTPTLDGTVASTPDTPGYSWSAPSFGVVLYLLDKQDFSGGVWTQPIVTSLTGIKTYDGTTVQPVIASPGTGQAWSIGATLWGPSCFSLYIRAKIPVLVTPDGGGTPYWTQLTWVASFVNNPPATQVEGAYDVQVNYGIGTLGFGTYTQTINLEVCPCGSSYPVSSPPLCSTDCSTMPNLLTVTGQVWQVIVGPTGIAAPATYIGEYSGTATQDGTGCEWETEQTTEFNSLAAGYPANYYFQPLVTLGDPDVDGIFCNWLITYGNEPATAAPAGLQNIWPNTSVLGGPYADPAVSSLVTTSTTMAEGVYLFLRNAVIT